MGIKEELQTNYSLTIEEIESQLIDLGYPEKEINFSKEDEDLIYEHFRNEYSRQCLENEKIINDSGKAALEISEIVQERVNENAKQMASGLIEEVSLLLQTQVKDNVANFLGSGKIQQGCWEEVAKKKQKTKKYFGFLAQYKQQRQLLGKNYPAITPAAEENS